MVRALGFANSYQGSDKSKLFKVNKQLKISEVNKKFSLNALCAHMAHCGALEDE